MCPKVPSVSQNGCLALVKWLRQSRRLKVKNLDFDHPIIERALGDQEQMSSHTFSFNISINDRLATVRGLLSTISSVYVPLGFVAPFILMADVIPQDLCRKKLD